MPSPWRQRKVLSHLPGVDGRGCHDNRSPGVGLRGAAGLHHPVDPARAPAHSRSGTNSPVPRRPEGGGWKAPRCVRGGDPGTRAVRPRASKWHSARTRDSSLRGRGLQASARLPSHPPAPLTFSSRALGGGWRRAFPVRRPGSGLAAAGRAFSSGRARGLYLRLSRTPVLSVDTEPHMGWHQAPPPQLPESSSYSPVGRQCLPIASGPASLPSRVFGHPPLFGPGSTVPSAERPKKPFFPALSRCTGGSSAP